MKAKGSRGGTAHGRPCFVKASGNRIANRERCRATTVFLAQAGSRETAMLRFAETIPLRTRLPGAAWLVAALVTLFSMLAMHAHAASEAPAPGVERTVPQGQDAPGPENGSKPLPDAKP